MSTEKPVLRVLGSIHAGGDWVRFDRDQCRGGLLELPAQTHGGASLAVKAGFADEF